MLKDKINRGSWLNWREAAGKRGRALRAVTTVGAKARGPGAGRCMPGTWEAACCPWSILGRAARVRSWWEADVGRTPATEGLCQVLDGIFPSPPEHSPPSSTPLPLLGHWPVRTTAKASLILGRWQNVVLASPQVPPVMDWTLSAQNPYVEALTPKVPVFGDRALKYIIKVHWVHKGSNLTGWVSLEEEETPEISLPLFMCSQRKGQVRTQWEGGCL